MDACSWSMLRRSDCRSNSRFPYDPRLPAFATVNQSQRGSGNTDVARGTKARTVKAILGREFEGRNNFPLRLSHACRSCQSPDQDPLNFLHSFTGLLQLIRDWPVLDLVSARRLSELGRHRAHHGGGLHRALFQQPAPRRLTCGPSSLRGPQVRIDTREACWLMKFTGKA